MLHPAFAAIDCFHPDLLSDAAYWRGHLPVAGVLVALLRPRLVVELGVQNGDSLFTFAEAMIRHGAEDGQVIGIDAWEGDTHVGAQAGWVHARVATQALRFPNVQVIRSRFDAAAELVANGSADLIHIDGGHAEEDVRADLDAYLPKLAPNGIFLLHDITAYAPRFGVWRVWQDLADAHPTFAFAHSAGLGLVAPKGIPPALASWLGDDRAVRLRLAKTFSALGHNTLLTHSTPDQIARVKAIGRITLPEDLKRTNALLDVLINTRW